MGNKLSSKKASKEQKLYKYPTTINTTLPDSPIDTPLSPNILSFRTPIYLPHKIKNNIPFEIINSYIIVRDMNNNNKSIPNYYYKVYNKKTLKYCFMKISTTNKIHYNECYVYNLVNNEHPNIIKLLYKFEHPDFIILITPWYEKDLFSVIESDTLTESQIKNIITKIASALLFLLNKNILYTDLKCENIMMTPDYEPILIDMDLYIILTPETKNSTHHVRGTGLCTYTYKSPECIIYSEYSHKTLTWKLGHILYLLIERTHHPFDADMFTKFINKNISLIGKYNEYKKLICKPLYKNIPYNDNLSNLLSNLLEPNPILRIDIHNTLKHKWLT